MEGNRCRIIRRRSPSVRSVTAVITSVSTRYSTSGPQFSFRRSFIKPDDTNAEGIDDVGVVLLSSGAACPGGDAKVAEFQEH